MRYRFGEYELDDAAYTLTRAGTAIPLQPKMFELLRYLIEQRERVVTKDELLDTLWPGEHVNQSAVTWTVSHVRNALGQGRGHKRPIETIHGRGYRFTAPIEALAAAHATSPVRVQATATTPPPGVTPRPFVGRTAVMRRLEALLRDATAGHGHICLLLGEAGIGKTRCAHELMNGAQVGGISAFVGRAAPGAGAPVFWPFIQIVREMVRTRPELHEVGNEVLSRLVAFDREQSEPEPTSDRRAAAGRFWLLESVTRCLLQASKSAPVLLLIDDLQWADAGSLDLLAFLATELVNERLLVIATQRPTEIQADEQRLTRIARHAERIELTELATEDIGLYIAEVCGLPEAPLPLAAAVHRATAGNPLFVQETVRALVTEHGEDALPSITPAQVKPPEVARDVLGARLRSLPPDTRSMLATASVLGEEFELPLLQTVSGLELDELLKRVDYAVAQGLLEVETPQRRAFSHTLLRQVLYDDMKAAERVATHRAAAIALEAFTSAEPHYSEIAHHYYCSLPAGAYDRVTVAAERAAAAAQLVYAHADAVRYFSWALEAQALDPGATPRKRAELLLKTGTSQRYSGRDADARSTIKRMFELARAHRYPDLLLRGVRLLRPTFAMSTVADPLVRDALEDVLKMEASETSEQRILAMSLLACVPPYAHDMTRSKELSGRALDLARGHATEPVLFEAMRARFFSLSGPDDIDELLTLANEAISQESVRLTATSYDALTARAGALLYRGEVSAADQVFDSIGRVADKVRLPELLFYHRRQIIQRRLLDGHFAAAEAGCNELQRQIEHTGPSYGNAFIGTLRRLLTTLQSGPSAVASGIDFTVLGNPSPMIYPNVRAWLTRVAAELGRKELARVGLDSFAVYGFHKVPKDIAYLNTLANVAQAAALIGDARSAEQLYGLLAPYPHHNAIDAMLIYQGPVARSLALLAASMGKPDAEVEGHFENAIGMLSRMGMRPMLARTRYEYARFLAGRSDAGAKKRAAELAQSAVEVARGLHMGWLETLAHEIGTSA